MRANCTISLHSGLSSEAKDNLIMLIDPDQRQSSMLGLEAVARTSSLMSQQATLTAQKLALA